MQIATIARPSLRLPRLWWLLPSVLGGAAVWVKILGVSLAALG
jgi:hypothetical protein